MCIARSQQADGLPLATATCLHGLWAGLRGSQTSHPDGLCKMKMARAGQGSPASFHMRPNTVRHLQALTRTTGKGPWEARTLGHPQTARARPILPQLASDDCAGGDRPLSPPAGGHQREYEPDASARREWVASGARRSSPPLSRVLVLARIRARCVVAPRPDALSCASRSLRDHPAAYRRTGVGHKRGICPAA